MRFTPTHIDGVVIAEQDVNEDARGSFRRIWCAEELAAQGLNARLAQASVSFNRRAHTLRGMHLQRPPAEEAKLVGCLTGRLYDVVVDLRPASRSYCRWVAVELSASNRRMIYVPEGCAHGFQTLADDTEVLYFISTPYSPSHAAGVRWDDPAFGIEWPPAARRIISARDAAYPDFEP